MPFLLSQPQPLVLALQVSRAHRCYLWHEQLRESLLAVSLGRRWQARPTLSPTFPSPWPTVRSYPPVPGTLDYRPLMVPPSSDSLFLCATRNASASLAAAKFRGTRTSPTYNYL